MEVSFVRIRESPCAIVCGWNYSWLIGVVENWSGAGRCQQTSFSVSAIHSTSSRHQNFVEPNYCPRVHVRLSGSELLRTASLVSRLSSLSAPSPHPWFLRSNLHAHCAALYSVPESVLKKQKTQAAISAAAATAAADAKKVFPDAL